MHILLFIFAIPFIGAVLHDLYLNYFVEDAKMQELLSLDIKPEEFKFTDLGWVIEHYIPGFLENIQMSFSNDVWEGWILSVLKEPTILVTAVPFAIAFAAWLVIFLFGFIKNKAAIGFSTKKDKDVYDYAKKESIKFKRK